MRFPFIPCLLLSLTAACADATQAAEQRASSDLWALDVADDLTVAVWVSPAVRAPGGAWLRFVNANFASDAPETPAGATSVPVRLDARTPITLADGDIAVRISPAPDLTWGDVEQRLDVIRERLPSLRPDTSDR